MDGPISYTDLYVFFYSHMDYPGFLPSVQLSGTTPICRAVGPAVASDRGSHAVSIRIGKFHEQYFKATPECIDASRSLYGTVWSVY